MKRALRIQRLSVAVLVPGLVATACVGPSVPTAVVRSEAFVHRVRAEGSLEAVESTVIGVPVQVRRRARIAWLEEDGASVSAGDVVLRFDPSEMEIDLENARGELAKNQHQERKTAATTESQARDLDKDSRLADLELEVAERFRPTDDEIYSRNEILESQIDGDLAQVRKEHTLSVGEIRSEVSASDVELIEIAEALARERLENARLGLSALEVRAPHDGLLIWTRNWRGEILKVGAEVWRGSDLGRLPKLDGMHAKVYVLEADASGMSVGDQATLLVASRPERPLQAEVVAIGAVSQPRFRGSPVRYFEVTLQPEIDDTLALKPGQRVSALIDIENRPDALVVPRQALRSDDEDETFVWRRDGGEFRRVAVEVGPRSLALAVIEQGLRAGDLVALEDPQQAGASSENGGRSPIADPSRASGGGR